MEDLVVRGLITLVEWDSEAPYNRWWILQARSASDELTPATGQQSCMVLSHIFDYENEEMALAAMIQNGNSGVPDFYVDMVSWKSSYMNGLLQLREAFYLL